MVLVVTSNIKIGFSQQIIKNTGQKFISENCNIFYCPVSKYKTTIMEKITNFKKKFSNKLLECRKKGLVQYGRYLTDQLKYASKAEIRKHYKIYVEDQIAYNNTLLNRIEARLSQTMPQQN